MSGAGYDFSRRTGEVFIRNFDRGVVETMGGYIDNPSSFGIDMVKMLGGDKKNYFIDVPDASEDPIPVIFGNPEAIKERQIYPSFLVIRGDPAPALNRWHSVGQKEYRIPGPNAVVEYSAEYGVSGYSEYEETVQNWPYDIPYQIQVYARLENEVIPMLKKVLRTYKPYCRIILQDSLEETRTYTAFQQSVNDISELVDIADRVKAYSVELMVEGELTLSDPVVKPSVTDIRHTVHRR